MTRSCPAFFDVLRAVPFLLARPRLLGLAVVPMLINVIVAVALVLVLERLLIEPALESNAAGTSGVLADLWRAFLWTALWVTTLGVAAIGCLALAAPLGAPFYDIMGERIERELLAGQPGLLAPPMPVLKSALHAGFEGLRRLAIVAPILVLLVLLNFIPVIGWATAAILGFVNAAIFLPFDAYAYAMDRRGWKFGAKWRWLAGRRGEWAWFGAGLAVCVAIPCAIFWYPPLAAVAGTRRFCARIIGDARA